jgi:hypothetical protein
MFAEFVFKLIDGTGAVDRFGRVVVIGDVVVERAFESSSAEKRWSSFSGWMSR